MRRIFVWSLVLMACGSAALAQAAQQCSIAGDRSDGKMRFSWQRESCADEGKCHEGDSDMAWSRWSGVTPSDLEHEGAVVDARLKAEAGEMRCAGTVHDGALRGTYSFTPDAAFAHHMEAMGFDGQTTERLQGYAMLDVTTAWVKGMKDAGVQAMTAENVMGLRALRVDEAYVRGMAAAGYPELRAEKLTGMKAVGVSPEKVQQVRAMGYSPTQEELIQMSVFKIDAPFVARMKARGFQNPTIAQLVKIKVFKLDE